MLVQSKNKKVYLEAMRILAIVLVIFNHLPGFLLYQTTSGAKQFPCMLLTVFTQINVPLFFMISGALLLQKEEDFATVFKKRISRFLLVILLFEGAQFCLYAVKASIEGQEFGFTPKRFIYELLAGTLDVTYWYLYAYLGFLFMLPFMQRIARSITKQDFWVLMGLHCFFATIIPVANILLRGKEIREIAVTDSFSVPLATTKAFFYPLIGYYLEHHVEVTKFKGKHVAVLVSVGLTGLLLSWCCTYWEGTLTGDFTHLYGQLFDYGIVAVTFLLIKYLMVCQCPSLSQGKSGKILCGIGSLTFGMYLIDPFFKITIYDSYEALLKPVLPTLMISILWIAISMVMGGIITALLKKIPGIKTLL